MRIQTDKVGANVEILKSQNCVTFTTTVPEAKGILEKGKKIVKKGTVLPANDGTAKGILFADTEVTNGDAPGTLVVEGYVYEDRLPETVTPEAKAALKEIKFV